MSESRIGIIGGTGLYGLDGLVELGWREVETAFGSPSDALLLGRYGGREVVFLPRHGRGHTVLPSELNHRANIMAMKQLGVRWILSVSAVGSLQACYEPCDVVVVDQFLDRTKRGLAQTFFGGGIVAHVAFAEPVCAELRVGILEAARGLGVSVHDGGTYVNMEGPAFSTRAESLQNHRDGHAVVGMTNLGEAKCAREAEIAYAVMAQVTDYDSWKPHGAHVTVEAVMGCVERNSVVARGVVGRVIEGFGWGGCSCHGALEGAILTERGRWSSGAVEVLRPILGRFL